MCRELSLWKTECEVELLHLAGSDLEDLEFQSRGAMPVMDMPVMARLTRLTRLSLSKQEVGSLPGLQRFQNLQWLCLDQSQNIQSALVVPGGLTALQSLRMYDTRDSLTDFSKQLQDMEPEAQQEAEQLRRTGEALLQLPSLTEIFGRSKLCMPGILDEQHGWLRVPGPCSSCSEPWDSLCEYCSTYKFFLVKKSWFDKLENV